MRTLSLQMVLGLLAAVAFARADSPPVPSPPSAATTVDAADDAFDPARAMERFRENERNLFDALSADPSPRRQALAGRIYVDADDLGPLRAKPAEVLARASELASDDALVQWLAASEGHYASSSCGPTTWPDREVANLVRLEADNAAAWQFEVALAHARNQPDALDQALSRMAASTRADDHIADELGAWVDAFSTYPQVPSAFGQLWADSDSPARTKAFGAALARMHSRYSPAKSALEDACRLDAKSDTTWQRLGWCADIGRLLANEGTSLALREQGLALLEAIGDRSDATASAQRQYDWLAAHDAHPLRNYKLMRDPPAPIIADWAGAPSEIAAIERRLRRLGEPLSPPDSWSAKAEETRASVEMRQAADAQAAFMREVLADMRASSVLHEQVLALSMPAMFAYESTGVAAPGESAASENEERDALAALAAAHPDDLFTQWTVASRGGDTAAVKAAIATVQRLDPDNAAVWSLSVGASGADGLSALQRMAASSRYDDFTGQTMRLWLSVFERQPTQALANIAKSMGEPEELSNDVLVKGSAVMMANDGRSGGWTVAKACRSTDEARKAPCIAVARLLLHKGESLLDALTGTAILGYFDAADATDKERTRQIAWWRENTLQHFGADAGQRAAMLDDLLSSGSELDALQRAAARAGNAEPPADWTPIREG